MNYTLVGAFVLVLGAGLVAVVLWLAAGGAWQKKYDLYLAIEDESVAGLNVGAPVKYNGVDIGMVRQIRLDPGNPKRVRLLLAIERGTPIKLDTLAQLKTQGLTGIAYVELSGGFHNAAPLLATAAEAYPVIRTKASLSARLENVLSSVLAKLDHTSSNIDEVFSDANKAALSSALADFAALSHTLAARRQTIDAGLVSAARGFEQGARVVAQVGPVVERIGRGADAMALMGGAAASASSDAGKAVAAVGADVQRFSADALPELQRLMAEMDLLSTSLRRLSDQTERNPAGFLFGRAPVAAGPGETSTGGARP